MESTNEELRELTLLEKIENDPDVNQSTLATQLGVAVGTVNWHLKRLIAKGYVKVKRAERKKLHYIITPEVLPCAPVLPWIAWRGRFPFIAKRASACGNISRKSRVLVMTASALLAKAMWRIFAD